MQLRTVIKQDKFIFLSLLLFSLLTLFFGTKSSPLYLFNEWPDPNAYFTMAKGWVNGYIPYKDLFDHKGPFLYVIFGIGYIISNDSFVGIYILQSISFAIVLYFIYKLGRLFVSKQYAYVASLCFSIVYFKINLWGGSAEEFILLFQAIGVYLIFKHFTDKDNPRNSLYILIQGILIGCVALIKFNLIIFWFIPLLAIIIQTIIDKDFKLAIKYTLLVILGIIMVIIPFIVYFFWVDGLRDFWGVYIIFNSIYASKSFDWLILMKEPTVHPIIFIVCIIGVCYFSLNQDKIKKALFRASFLPMFFFTYLAIYKSAFYAYYIISLSTFCALGIIALFSIVQKRYHKIYNWHILIIFLLVIGINLVSKRKTIKSINNHYFQLEFVQYIKEHTEKKDIKILNLGMDDCYFLLTNTIPANKYFYLPNVEYSQYPLIVDTNIGIIKSDEAPLYITISRYITMDNIQTSGDIYFPTIQSKYELVKENTSYETWPGTQHFLYKLKETSRQSQ